MIRKSFFTQNFYFIFLLLASLSGSALILFLTSLNGPGISNDSVSYLAASHTLLKFNELLLWDYKYLYSLWPPLFPFLLSFFQLIGLESVQASIVLNALCFGGLIFISGIISRRVLVNKYLVYLCPLLVLFSRPLILVYGYLWTEPLFVFLCLLFVYYLANYLNQSTLKNCIITALIVATAIMVRYVGIVCLGVGGLLILFATAQPFKRKVQHIFLFSLVSCLPVFIWFIRNAIATTTLTGAGRNFSILTPKHFTKVTVRTVWEWFLPYFKFIKPTIAYIAVFLVLLAFYLFLWKLIRSGAWSRKVNLLIAAGAFATLYVFFVFTASVFQASSWVDYRISSPAVVPGYVMLLFVLDSLINKVTKPQFKKAAIACSYLLLVSGVWYGVAYIKEVNKIGIIGYDDVKTDTSPTFKFAETILPSSQIQVYSNVPEGLYYRYRRPYNSIYPLDKFYEEFSFYDKAIEKLEYNENQKTYLVWVYFDGIPKGDLLSKVLQINKMKLLKDYPDGAIYVLEK